MERTEQDLAVVQEMYRAFERADLARTLQLCAPDVEVRQSPAVPWGGTYRGHDGVVAFLVALGTHLDSRPQTQDLFADAGGAVVQVGRTRGTVRATGAAFDVAETHVWTVRDGLVVRFEAYLDADAMLTALAQPADAVAAAAAPA
jgi:ketosteroid isomerase-like protein